ncbi:MAG: pitrilysin family protein [Oscillospiraceae bacterium]
MNKNLKVIENARIGEKYYSYTHESGLEILLYPMKGYSSCYALFGTKYGSIDSTFKKDDDKEFVTVPDGIAHFLEHKLFENEDGKNAFQHFSQMGASSNAFTDFDRTCYLFSSSDNINEALAYLIKNVQAPYFTDENVEKEQGIIGQEIRMYEDDPNWKVYYNLIDAMYVNNPVKIDIAGTIESISKINKDILYYCYNTFYNLSNMVISVAGNFDVDEALDIIIKGLKTEKKVTIHREEFTEPDALNKKEVTQQLEVSIPLFNIGYKEKFTDNSLEDYVIFTLITDIIAGKGGKLYKELYEEQLVDADFGAAALYGRGFLSTIFAGESRNPKEVLKRLENTISQYKKNGISQDEFERIRKSLYGRAVMGFNSVSNVSEGLIGNRMVGNHIFDFINCIAELKLEKVNTLLKNSFKESAISIVEPVK